MKDIPVFIEKLYKYELKNEVCSVAVPFPEGELMPDDIKRLFMDGKRLQAKPTAVWQDGSVKYLFLDFMADLPANRSCTLGLKLKEDAACADSAEDGMSVAEENGSIAVDTGAVRFSVGAQCSHIFTEVTASGKTYQAKQFVGPVIGVGGQELTLFIDTWKIAEHGAVKTVLFGTGSYGNTYRGTVKITAYYGKEYLDVAFRLFNDTAEELTPDYWSFYVKREEKSTLTTELLPPQTDSLDSTGCGDMNRGEHREGALYFRTTGLGNLAEICREIEDNSVKKIRTFTGISNYKTCFTISGEGAAVENRITAKSLIDEANEHFAEVFYGTFMADVTAGDGGVCATVFQAHQNFPKAIKADCGGVYVYLIPQGDERVTFQTGMARQQRIQLHFHEAAETIEELDNRSLIYQMPVTASVPPELFRESGLFCDVVSDFSRADDEVELALISKADSHGRAYGMMNWGDFPDSNYTAQGRGGGRLVWTNNEYDYPHAMFLMYARTGVRRFLDYAKTAAWHWMDVDVCHYSKDALHIGGQWEHTACHNGGSGENAAGVMVCSHEWVEGLLDLWHFTGDEEARATALGIGENVLRLLDTPMYQTAGEANARETGWALRTLIALYLETNDKRWLVKCEWILEQFKTWHEKYGAWLAPYTDNTVIRVGFMISVALGSIMRYYRVFPRKELKELMLAAVDDLVCNFRNPYGLFYYKELPSLKRNGNNTLLLEAMYIGYELTGDAGYLKAGLKTFWSNIRTEAKYESGKRICEDAVLVGNAPTKSFAQSFLPLVQYYNACIKENII